MQAEILAMAQALAGDGAVGQAEALGGFCQAAEAELRLRLGSQRTLESCGPAGICAGAYLALARFMPQAGGQIKAFTAGNLSVTNAGAGELSAQLERLAEQLMAPYWDGGGFAFQGVRG